MIISLGVLVLMYYLFFTNFDFKDLISNFFPDANISSYNLEIITLFSIISLSFVVVSFFKIHEKLIFNNRNGYEIFDSEDDYINYNKKRLKYFSLHALIVSSALGLNAFILFTRYFKASYDEVYTFYQDTTGMEYYVNVGFYYILISIIGLFVAGVVIKYLAIASSSYNGVYRMNTDFCKRCHAGGNEMIVLSNSTSKSETEIDKMDGFRYVDTNLTYDSTVDKINISSTPKTILTKEETTTTTSREYHTCRSCGFTDITTKVGVTKKKYTNSDGKWRER